MYKQIIKPILFLFNPEKVHDFFIASGRFVGSNRILKRTIKYFYLYNGPDISKTVDGIKYKTPILLSAGFDCNADLTSVLSSMSFGGEEVGSVTAKKCLGNEGIKLTRLKNTKSILVNKGLKNDGVDTISERLKKIKRADDFVIGVSIARTNSPDCNTVELGIEDYYYSLKTLNEKEVGDYYTINISCPNAYCGETFINPENLEKLLTRLDTLNVSKPIYVKMPISVEDNHFIKILDILLAHKISGVVVGNLQKDYSFINDADDRPKEYRGGLSGKPCKERSNYLIKLTRDKMGNDFTIIGVGGIFSPEDAEEKFKNGADLIQLITGMIYEGPGLIKNICRSIGEK